MKSLPSLLLAALSAAFLVQCNSLPEPVPPQMLPPSFCYVDTVAPTVQTDLKYAGSDNFVGRPIWGYTGHRAVLRRDAAECIARAAAALAKDGYGLRIYDAYRPALAMQDFYGWSKTDDDRMKARFYPHLTKKGIYEGKYIGTISEHSWGVAVDITLISLSSGKECDMGGHHDLLDESSATDYPHLTAEQKANRRRLCKAMEAAGMQNYSKEWWHYFVHPMGTVYSYSFPLNDRL